MKKTTEYLKETGRLDDIMKMIRNGLTKGGFDLLVTCMVDSDDNWKKNGLMTSIIRDWTTCGITVSLN